MASRRKSLADRFEAFFTAANKLEPCVGIPDTVPSKTSMRRARSAPSSEPGSRPGTARIRKYSRAVLETDHLEHGSLKSDLAIPANDQSFEGSLATLVARFEIELETHIQSSAQEPLVPNACWALSGDVLYSPFTDSKTKGRNSCHRKLGALFTGAYEEMVRLEHV